MKIKYWVIDVDGTMTDGGIYYDENGNETKKFNTFDAAGFFAAHEAGMKIIVLTGRECQATKRRMTELKVDYLFQGVRDKRSFLTSFMEEHQISKDELGYIGDDLNDLAGMELAGFVACPDNSCEEVKSVADYVSQVKGGNGAVRDVISYVLKKEGTWETIVRKVYDFNNTGI